MSKSLLAVALCAAAAVSACATARHGAARPPESSQQVARAGTQAPTIGSIDHFTGHVRVDPLFAISEDIDAAGAYVTFEPGARSAWHSHPAGQRLVVTSGVGLTQERGKAVQEVHAGDVIVCPPGIEHWHGAAPTSAMTHLAVTGSRDGQSVLWRARVTDEEYEAAAAASRSQREPVEAEKATARRDLSASQQAILLVAAFSATSDMPRLDSALNQGLDAGLAISDAKEVLVQLYAYIGFPRSLNALGELMKVVEARKRRGLHDAPGREPGRAIPSGDELLAAGTANQTRIAGAPVEGPLFEFAPVINRYLRAHLFGDIFERDNLDWQSRELATVGALAATPGVESQLRSHMAASLRVGLTVEQLRQVSEVLAERGEAQAAQRATEALTRALATAAQPVEPQPVTDSEASAPSRDAEALVSISRQKWLWMAERKVDALASLFHDEAVFVHMGGTMSKRQELDVIDNGTIHYKHADIHETSVRFVDGAGIVLSKIRLEAVVGGKEVTNPFTVTEVYVRRGASWMLGAMSFTRLLSQ